MQTHTFVWHVFIAVSLMIVKYQLVSADVQPNKCYFLSSTVLWTFPSALILVRDFKYSVFYYFKGYIFFSNPEGTADCKLAACIN